MVFETYGADRWPNPIRSGPQGHGGKQRFSKAELQRRLELVQQSLREQDADLLLIQGWFPAATAGVHTSVYWITGDNSYRNTVTVVVPQKGEISVVEGTKQFHNPGDQCPYCSGEDLRPYLQSAKRIAYDGLGYLGHQFYRFLNQCCPGVELVEFGPLLGKLKALKSEEELDLIRDSSQIHDKIYRAAPLLLQPGKTLYQISLELQEILGRLGADLSMMYKVYVGASSNGPLCAGSAGPDRQTDPMHVLRVDDFVTLGLETPGSGGYYAQGERYFFFQKPHPEIQTFYQAAKALYDYEASLYQPHLKREDFRRKIEAFDVSIQGKPAKATGGPCWGLGMLTVDRPNFLADWETLGLEPGIAFLNDAMVVQDGKGLRLSDMCIMTQQGPEFPCPYPMKLTIL